jgi:hypothetical protein
MTAPDTALKSQPLQQTAKVIKANRRISRAAQNALKGLVRAHATIVDVAVWPGADQGDEAMRGAATPHSPAGIFVLSVSASDRVGESDGAMG